jgi:hypothetical protein
MDNNRSMDEFDLFQYEISQPPEPTDLASIAKRSGIVAFNPAEECRQRIAHLSKAQEVDPLYVEAEISRLRIQRAIAEPIAPQTFNAGSGQPLSKALSPDPALDALLHLLETEIAPDPDPLAGLEDAHDIRPGGGIVPGRRFAKGMGAGDDSPEPEFLSKPIHQVLGLVAAKLSGPARELAQRMATAARASA